MNIIIAWLTKGRMLGCVTSLIKHDPKRQRLSRKNVVGMHTLIPAISLPFLVVLAAREFGFVRDYTKQTSRV